MLYLFLSFVLSVNPFSKRVQLGNQVQNYTKASDLTNGEVLKIVFWCEEQAQDARNKMFCCDFFDLAEVR